MYKETELRQSMQISFRMLIWEFASLPSGASPGGG